MNSPAPLRAAAAEASFELVASDLDMTLCPPGGMIGARTRAAIHRVREYGAHFTVASGRPTAGLIHTLGVHDIDPAGLYVIGFNGAAVAQAWDGTLVVSRTLTADVAAEVIQRARPFPVEVIIPEGDLVHTETPDGPGSQREAFLNGTTLHPVADLAAAGLAPHLVLIVGEPAALAAVARAIAPPLERVTQIVLAAPRLLLVTAKDVTKGTALTAMCAALGIRTERTVAFGDHHNDIPMIERAGLGVAVGNAVPEVKAAADYVTASCENEGVADVLDVLFPVAAYQ